MLMRSSCASVWDEQVLVVAFTGLNFRGEPPLPLLVRHETGPVLLRILVRHELAPQL
jgi:hypothetical protein